MRAARCVLAALALWSAGAAAEPPADPARFLAGQSIYRHGLLDSGEPVRASVQKGVALEGSDAACVNCHRRSGLGGSEGQNPIRPIAGRLLFSQTQTELERRWAVQPGPAARTVYTQESLARALREGVDPGGRRLDPLMPRYALSDEAVAALYTYLATLSSAPSPGVSDREIHFSTIVAPGVEPARRRALLDVLQAFVRDKNGGTRNEVRRRDAGSEQMYLAYRSWVLHVWELEGAPETWRAQLDAHYRRQPVFAVIGGLGGASWQPVHRFCEAVELPCVFPDVDYPALDGAGHYTLYFSRGLALEADVLARRLAESPGAEIVQVFRDDQTGRLPAQALREALGRRGIAVADAPVQGEGPVAAGFWRALFAARPAVLVVWLDADDLRSLDAAGPPPAGLERVYLSASLAGLGAPALSGPWLARLGMVYPFGLPEVRARHLARLNAWLRARHVAAGDPRIQANAFFAATIAGDALTHVGENFSRDYFIERIEQMVESALSPSIYPRLSLGPGQRFASRGGYIVGFPGEGDPSPVPLSGWLVP